MVVGYHSSRLRSLKRVIEKREGAASEKKRTRKLAKEEEPFRTKRLGRLPYPPHIVSILLFLVPNDNRFHVSSLSLSHVSGNLNLYYTQLCSW